MRAKEYAEIYKQDNSMLSKIAIDFLFEGRDLMKKRNVKTNSAALAILNELDDKWKAFVRLTNDPSIRHDGFRLLLKEDMPLVYEHWMNYRKQLAER